MKVYILTHINDYGSNYKDIISLENVVNPFTTCGYTKTHYIHMIMDKTGAMIVIRKL